MKETLIEFETAKLAKEKGFDEPSSFYYGALGKLHKSRQSLTQKSLRGSQGSCSAPTQSLLQKWLREDRIISVLVDFDLISNNGYMLFILDLADFKDYRVFKHGSVEDSFLDYESALETGLLEALKLIES